MASGGFRNAGPKPTSKLDRPPSSSSALYSAPKPSNKSRPSFAPHRAGKVAGHAGGSCFPLFSSSRLRSRPDCLHSLRLISDFTGLQDKLQMRLSGEGGIKALLGMVSFGHPDVLAQVARGIANFAKCESRSYAQGNELGVSLLIEDGALPWIVKNGNREASPIRRHIELALCHLAQHEVNAKDMISEGALGELVIVHEQISGCWHTQL